MPTDEGSASPIPTRTNVEQPYMHAFTCLGSEGYACTTGKHLLTASPGPRLTYIAILFISEIEQQNQVPRNCTRAHTYSVS
ncbi:hypothetical protein L211DRAFT_836792 [Terfezia boudieri ATCC MYA-4762]|uniref:Uncharacterized protein n=1 Tax=Terfezia boudieri ATCC MYA-4762 TaxID=1051890 RepID=A0A3N4LPS2_9PEZI|nr:hypothetical protein L211DRAFT_836792 [Terfezia boudieri ATCC MYA-4762]